MSEPPRTSVLSVARRCRPRPSKLYSILWRFASERQLIYLRRLSGKRGRGLMTPYCQHTGSPTPFALRIGSAST